MKGRELESSRTLVFFSFSRYPEAGPTAQPAGPSRYERDVFDVMGGYID